jgi:dGTPase
VTSGRPLLEAQVVDAADSLAYDTHDIDDALSIGLITSADLEEVPFWRLAVERVRTRRGQIGPLQFQPAVIRALIDWQVSDLLEQTQRRLRAERIRSVAEVRASAELLVCPGAEVRALKAGLEDFLHRKVYRHFRVVRMAQKGSRFLQQLFDEYCRHPAQLPERYAQRAAATSRERTVCDYLAGMTDRYAQDEFLRLFQPYAPV